jgi:hypothetical protein
MPVLAGRFSAPGAGLNADPSVFTGDPVRSPLVLADPAYLPFALTTSSLPKWGSGKKANGLFMPVIDQHWLFMTACFSAWRHRLRAEIH